MTDPKTFALNMIKRNPNLANNPQAQEMINVIQNGDSERGKQIATNMCNAYGVTPEEAIGKAKQFFNIQ